MDRQRENQVEIPSFVRALRCTCGRALGGTYCDGTHLQPPKAEDCRSTTAPSEQKADPQPALTGRETG